MEFFETLEYWHWLIFGAALIILEIILPSAVFLWPGLAALAIGVINFIAPEISWVTSMALWAGLSVLLAFGWQFYRKKNPSLEPRNTINRRGEQIVGRHFTLTKDITNGVGELHVDDTRWKVISSADIHAGKKVKVLGVEGTSLRVEEFTS